MRKMRNYSEIVHISPVCKRLIDEDVREHFIENNPNMKDGNISYNMLIMAMVKYYIGFDFFKKEKQYENEFNANHDKPDR